MKINLRLARLARRLSQIEIANLAGISISTFRRIEKNPYSAKRSTLIKVCNVLNIDIEELI